MHHAAVNSLYTGFTILDLFFNMWIPKTYPRSSSLRFSCSKLHTEDSQPSWVSSRTWPRPLTNEYSHGQYLPALAQRKATDAWNGGPTRWQGCFLHPFMQKDERKLPTRLRARAFYGPPKAALRHFHPSGECTHLPTSHPFCSCRTYLQGKTPRVTSPAEILRTAIDFISS